MNEDVIEVMVEHSDLFVTAGEVAEEIGVTSTTANERLHELREEGRVERKEVGANAVVWWVPEAITRQPTH